MMLRLIVLLLLLIKSIAVSAYLPENPPTEKPPRKPTEQPGKPVRKPPEQPGKSVRKTPEQPEKPVSNDNAQGSGVAESNTEKNNEVSPPKDDRLLLSLSNAERKTKENVEELRQIKNTLDGLLVQMDVDLKQISSQDSIEKISGLYLRFQENMSTVNAKVTSAEAFLAFIKQSQENVSSIRTTNDGKTYVKSIENQVQDAVGLSQQIEELVAKLNKNWQQISNTKIAYEKKMQEQLELQRKKEKMDIFRSQKIKDIQLANQQNVAMINKNFKDCEKCPEMTVVPAGQFVMGSREGEGKSDEQPQHEVFILRPFAVSKFEVTFAEWDFCVADGGCSDNKTNDGGWGRGNRPVIFISWSDAKSYVKWLSRKTSKNYRLLTEAEWEYVARAGTNAKYWWGEQITPNVANCDGCGSIYDNRKTAPVGTFSPNKFGIADILGNVYEWVEDCYINNYNEASVDGAVFSSQCEDGRVLQGGSWSTSNEKIRSAIRKKASPITQMDDYGMRIARDL